MILEVTEALQILVPKLVSPFLTVWATGLGGDGSIHKTFQGILKARQPIVSNSKGIVRQNNSQSDDEKCILYNIIICLHQDSEGETNIKYTTWIQDTTTNSSTYTEGKYYGLMAVLIYVTQHFTWLPYPGWGQQYQVCTPQGWLEEGRRWAAGHIGPFPADQWCPQAIHPQQDVEEVTEVLMNQHNFPPMSIFLCL